MLMKIGDRSHALTVVISVIAIVLSAASLFVAHRAMNNTEVVSRAVVQATDARLTSPPDKLTFLTIDLTLCNFGKAMAQDVRTAFEWDVTAITVPGATPSYFQPSHGSIAPGATRTFRVQANRRFAEGHGGTNQPGFDNPKAKLVIWGATYYKDALTGLHDRDVWCFLFDPTDKSQTGTLEFRRCEYQPLPGESPQ